MVLDAAASTSGGMLSLSANVDERDASASSSRSRALVLDGGAAAVQQDHVRSPAARQPSVRPSRQARAVQVHHRGDAVWPGLTPGRPARCARADPDRPMVALSRHGVPPGLGRPFGAQGAPQGRRGSYALKIVTICVTPACTIPTNPLTRSTPHRLSSGSQPSSLSQTRPRAPRRADASSACAGKIIR